MSRLIDADALIEVIKESRPLNWTDSESELQEDADYNHFIEMVNAQPTAYDIENVVAELEERRCKFDCKYCKHFFNGKKECDRDCADALIDDLFEIVRKGGVNG